MLCRAVPCCVVLAQTLRGSLGPGVKKACCTFCPSAPTYSRPTPSSPVVLPLAQVRAPTHIICTISDDRGEEPTYCGVTMSELMEADANVGDAIGWVGWLGGWRGEVATGWGDGGGCQRGGRHRVSGRVGGYL